MPTILFNGIQYPDPQDMPPEVRQAYEQALGMLADRDGNGLPDIFDQMAGQGMPDAGRGVRGALGRDCRPGAGLHRGDPCFPLMSTQAFL